jgi:AAA domain
MAGKERTDFAKVLVIAPSGYGKTFLSKTADLDKTGYINAENKPLPFKGNFKFHGKPKSWNGFLKNLEDYGNNQEIESIIIDSQSMALDTLHAEMKQNFKGFEVYGNYNTQVKRYLDLMKAINKDIIVLSHDESIIVDGYKQKRAKVHGKEFEGRLEAHYTIVLFGGKKLEDNKPRYFLKTFEEDTSSKVPESMFPGKDGSNSLEIPNDAKYIFDSLGKYYS